jgi:hypothetical protein
MGLEKMRARSHASFINVVSHRSCLLPWNLKRVYVSGTAEKSIVQMIVIEVRFMSFGEKLYARRI